MTKVKKIFIIIISLLVLWFFLLFTFLVNPSQNLTSLNFLSNEKINDLDNIYSK